MQLYSLLRYATLSFSFLFILLYVAKGKLTSTYVAYLLYAFWIFIACSFLAESDGETAKLIYNTAKIAGIVSLSFHGLSYNKYECLKGFIAAGLLMCSINIVTVFLYSNQIGGMKHGMLTVFGELTTNQYYFLGLDNYFVTLYLAMLTAMLYYAYDTNNRRLAIYACFYALLIFAIFIYLQTITAILVMGAFLIGSILLTFRNKDNELILPNIYLVIAIGIMVNIFIIYSHSIPLFDLVNQYVSKDRSFASRFSMWQNAEAFIASSPIYGVGVNDLWTVTVTIGLNHVHNIILQILYQGGFVGLFLFLLALQASYANLRLRALNPTSKADAIVLLCIFLYFMCGAMDYYITEETQYFIYVLASFFLYRVSHNTHFSSHVAYLKEG